MSCEKKPFKTRSEALKFIRRGPRNLKSKAGRVRAYFCDYCIKWHLTTQKKLKKRNFKYDKDNGLQKRKQD